MDQGGDHLARGALGGDLRALDPQSKSTESEAAGNKPVTKDTDGACTAACTSDAKNAHPDAVGGDFAEALAMIAALPLSDAEKAEAVRRLLTAKGNDDE